MDLLQMIAELRAEQQQIDAAILVIERLAAGTGGKRRGRPPKWLSATRTESAQQSDPKKKRVMRPRDAESDS
jgi:hypothetical protein